MVVSQAASGSASSLPGTIFMALLTRMSMRPRSLMMVSTSRAMSADLATSATTARLLLPSAAASLAVARRGRRIDVIDDDMGALAGIGQSDIAADAAAAAGDQRHLVLQSHGNSPISCSNSSEKSR